MNEGYNQIFQDKVVDMLKRHEGLKIFPYHCSQNKLTLGIGILL